MLILFDVIIFIYGVYTIYSSIQMKKTRKLSNWFIGNATTIRDAGGYIDYIFGRTLIMGGMAVLFGIVGFVNDYVKPVPDVMRVLLLLFLTVCIWFYVSINRAKRQFW
ncbi:MAG: hypothetical protein HFH41_05145 [Lachnospiraceae bacterium]|nr:hypothetical protein [Lachnospiraceae bacterium]